ncbi:MAG: amidohydrolase [Pseudomonadales bacterium]|jgi:hippurate hydrolase|nr:amidohydrolase [Pseudomonadales bacterium]MDP6471158.1 amidohydrolase [Pseudomonadales bacterium]MDP6825655.1 amidohydrolase [Pseudomonadales bacterium]MDP6971624.1 amidohydrolase [Pseudomonadales bacterium]|tara:strand:+ start:658 stop:1995 length:1338 start_codon:yes stop_codon:yes gene_type:complete
MYKPLLLVLCLVWTDFAQTGLREDIRRDSNYVRQLYEYLHANPELSWAEQATAAHLANALRELGFDVTPGVGGHGVVAVLRNGKGPTLALRADMDALPVRENTGLEYASTVTTSNDSGQTVAVMHACGHDVHMSVLVGSARRLAAMQSTWQGTLLLIAQPAEEVGGGARAMLDDGLYQRFPRPDYNFALHVSADLAAGRIGYVAGYSMANVDSVDIHVSGVGGHGAYPHLTKDPVVIAAQIVMALQTIVSREISPLESAVITVGSIHGGTKHNVISNGVDLQLTVRSYADETRNFLLRRIREISEGIALTNGLSGPLLPTVTVRDEYTPSVFNEPALVQRIAAHLSERLGAARLAQVPPVMAGEDFSRYARVTPKIPSALFWLGAVNPILIEEAKASGQSLPSLHSAQFAPLPGPTLEAGIHAMTETALLLLGSPQREMIAPPLR